MPKKRKKQKTAAEAAVRYVPVEDLIRRTFSHSMVRDAGFLDIHRRGVKMYVDGDQVNAFSEKERQFLREAEECLARATKILLVIGRRDQRAG